MDEPDSSTAVKSSDNQNSDNVNKTSTVTDVYDFDSHEALKKAKVDIKHPFSVVDFNLPQRIT